MPVPSTAPVLRVAHVGPDPAGRGGMAAVLRTLFASSLASRYQLEMISTYRSARPATRLVVFALALASLVRWCAGRGPRLVHVHTTVRGSLYRKSACVFASKALRRKVILHVHSGVGDIESFHARLGPVRRALIGRAFVAADRVLSVSAAGAREVERRFGRRGIEVVPNAAPLVESPPEDQRAKAPSAVTIAYLGGFLNPVKGGVVLVEALPSILAGLPEAQITLAGPGEPPVGAPGLEDARVRWAGWLEPAETGRLLERADLFVLPSISEGLPVALLEAMAHGLAVVATRAGGIPEVLTHDENGVLVRPGDAGALSEAVIALARDRGTRERLGGAARARAVRLNEDEVSGRLDRIYRELVPG